MNVYIIESMVVSTEELLQEAAVKMSGKHTVDNTGLVTDVHIAGLKSKNGHTYKESALQEASALYDNADMFMDHTYEKDKKTTPRSPKDKVGFIKGAARFVESKGLVGDIQLNPEHPLFKALKWWIENAPGKLGLSQVIGGTIDGDKKEITKITKVASVDIVSDPATTQGMFLEGVLGDKIAQDQEDSRIRDLLYTFQSMCYEFIWPLSSVLTAGEKAAKIRPLAQDLVKELTSLSGINQKESNQEEGIDTMYKTVAEFKEKQKDLYDSIVKESSQLAVDAERSTVQKLEAAVKDIPTEKRTKVFMKAIREAIEKGEETVELIAEHKSLITVETPVSKSGKAKETEVEKEEGAKKSISDEDILSAIK